MCFFFFFLFFFFLDPMNLNVGLLSHAFFMSPYVSMKCSFKFMSFYYCNKYVTPKKKTVQIKIKQYVLREEQQILKHWNILTLELMQCSSFSKWRVVWWYCMTGFKTCPSRWKCSQWHWWEICFVISVIVQSNLIAGRMDIMMKLSK